MLVCWAYVFGSDSIRKRGIIFYMAVTQSLTIIEMMQILNCRAKVLFHLIGPFRGSIEVSASFSYICKLQLFAFTSLVIKPKTSVGLIIRLCAYHIAWQII